MPCISPSTFAKSDRIAAVIPTFGPPCGWRPMLKVGDLGETTHGLNVLKRVQDRFIDTSIGEGAKETTNAILHWLHELIQYIIP